LPVSVQEAKQIITGAAARPTQMISSARGAGEGSRRGAPKRVWAAHCGSFSNQPSV